MFGSKIFSVQLILLSMLVKPVTAGEVAIIVSKDTPVWQVSKSYLERVYRRKVLINAQGINWVPINLAAAHPVRIAFSKALFDQQPEQMETYWNIQYFKGITPPYVVSSERAMLRFVAATSGAIGYIPPCFADKTVRVVLTMTIPTQTERLCD